MNTGLEIAVIGMAGRFPGAPDIAAFWENLGKGVDSVAFFSDEELRAAGVGKELLNNPHYVKGRAVMEEIEYFDARFFGYTSREAEMLDPQFRIFHECIWTALESAGYNPQSYRGVIGLYAGTAFNPDWLARTLMGLDGFAAQFEASTFMNRDYFNTRISYKLNLRGPSFTVQTACSTSLVAIHLACQGLLNGECNIALAGGVSISTARKPGYLYQQGMITSADGHCRAFDARASGTTGGDGVGVVVLKCLEDAVADGDCIDAVIKSSAINNDGSQKVNYTAPGTKGQAAVIRAALRVGRVEPESIAYVETHGTGTRLGDPVEIEALREAFNTDRRGFCALGSVKTNIGHVNAAAGAAGFIKTVLALKHKLIPPSLHFEIPNPEIDFEHSPFYINTMLSEWKSEKFPRRAGVSSFGIGGTNAHVILEEAPRIERRGQGRKWQLIVLSARSETALAKAAENLCQHFSSNAAVNLAEAAYTLQVGRRWFEYRQMFVCSGTDEAIKCLASPDSRRVQHHFVGDKDSPVIFMFPGLGSQYVNMGRELYEEERAFAEEMDCCFEILGGLTDFDLKEILYPGVSGSKPSNPSPARIGEIEIAQLAVFIFEYALARMLMKWGIKPRAMIGYSFGEYAAACLSAVFSLEDGLRLILSRGRLLKQVGEGAMLSVPLAVEEVSPLLNGELSVAVDNGQSCVVAGPVTPIDTFERQMKEQRYLCMRLENSTALHSKMMEPILQDFEQAVSRTKLNRPRIPFVSNVTGHWIRDGESTDPGYWARHLRHTVRFADGLKELVKEEKAIFTEIGPGRDLGALLKRYLNENAGQKVINIIRSPEQDQSDVHYLLNKIGCLWLYGAEIDWIEFHRGQRRHRIPLPTYPFERQQYWIEGDLANFNPEILFKKTLSDRKPDMSDWFYIPSWKRSGLAASLMDRQRAYPDTLFFMDECGLGSLLVKKIKQRGSRVMTVKRGSAFVREGDGEYLLDPRREEDYDALFGDLHRLSRMPATIVHLWSITDHHSKEWNPAEVEEIQDLGFHSLLNIARAVGRQAFTGKIHIKLVVNRMQEVTGDEETCPLKATALGAIKTIPKEYPHIGCSCVDILFPVPGAGKDERVVDQLLVEFFNGTDGDNIAYRGNHRWVQTFVPLRFEEPKERPALLREEGVYLITGGLGGIGLTLAEYLASEVRARLVLIGRSSFPERDRWQEWLDRDQEADKISRKILKMRELEEWGAEVMVMSADVSDLEQMRRVFSQVMARFGKINGVIHSAGIPDGAAIHRRTRAASKEVFAAKIKGTLVLNGILKDIKLDFLVLCSSIDAIFGVFGQVGYCAANAFLDAFAHYKRFLDDTLIVSINWNAWQEVGMAVEAKRRLLGREDISDSGVMTDNSILPSEGMDVFSRILDNTLSQVAISTRDLVLKIEQHDGQDDREADLLASLEAAVSSSTKHQRPQLSTEFIAPGSEIEKMLAKTFQGLFGLEEVGIDDDFFELGGDSLKAMILASRIHKDFNVKVQLTGIYKTPTIRGLSQSIKAASKEEYESIEPVEKREYYSLSSAQKRLCFLQQMDVNSTGYNMPFAVLFEQDIKREKLERIFVRLIARHESLRTSFPLVHDEPVQRVYDEVDFNIECVEGEGSDEMIGGFICPFDLSQAPLIRVRLVRQEEKKYLLLLDMHHIISDGVSVNLLVGDFMALFENKELPELKVQYKDFSHWQNRLIESGVIQNQREYWLNRFGDKIPSLNLPTDYADAAEVNGFEGDRFMFRLDAGLSGEIRRLALETEATLYMVLLAGFNVLLSKYTDQEDIVVGSPVLGRSHADLENIIGMFVNMLPMRNCPAKDKRFIAFLKEVRENALNAFENQDYQFDQLVWELSKRSGGKRQLKITAAFGLDNMAGISGQLSLFDTPGLAVKPYVFSHRVSRFDLSLGGSEVGDEIVLSLEYRSSLFKRQTIERMACHLINIFEGVVAKPQVRIAEIGMLSADDRINLIREIKGEDQLTLQAARSFGLPDTGRVEAEFDF